MKYELPTLIYQETDCVKKHAGELTALGSRALIVTGRSSSKKNGALKDVCDALDSVNISYVLFDEIEENPSVESCARAAGLGLREQTDFCIGIGGGSPLDASKAIALLIGNCTNDASGFYTRGFYRKPAVPVVSVPTTAGTGSEATPYAILTLHDQHTKKSISYRVFPELSLCDSKYLHFVPYQILKNTAIDALAHLIESYLNTNTTLYSRMFAEYGLKLWGEIKDDLMGLSFSDSGYEKLLATATIAGMAITHTGTSIPHGLSYPVTYEDKIPHGASCGLFLPGYLAFCKRHEDMGTTPSSGVITKNDTAQIYSFLGLKGIEDFAMMLYNLLGDIPVPETLWQKDVDSLLSNPDKLKNCPYPITRAELLDFI